MNDRPMSGVIGTDSKPLPAACRVRGRVMGVRHGRICKDGVGVLVTALGLLVGIPATHAQDIAADSTAPTVFFIDSNAFPVPREGWSAGIETDPSNSFTISDRHGTGGSPRFVITLESTPNNANAMYVSGLGNVYLANFTTYFDRTTGRVGIGTNDPQGNLHISGGAGQDIFNGIGPDLVNGPAFNFGYSGSSFGRGSGFFNVRPDAAAIPPNPSLRFATENIQRMIITNDGNVGIGTLTPGNPLEMGSGAFVSFGGVWVNASSREYKQDIQPLSSGAAQAALERLAPVTFAYRAAPAEHHVGFIAEDVPDLVATADRKGLSPMDIVGVLTRVVQEQQRKLETQEAARAAQEAAIAALVAEVAALRRATDAATLTSLK